MTDIDPGSKSARIGIVGGGIAGLTVAYRLSQSGYRVTLWEPDLELGGLASAFEVPGGRLERFYHHLFMSDTSIARLIEELGIGDHLLWLDSQNSYYSRGKVYSLASPFDLLRLPVVPLVDRVRIGLVTLYLQRITPEGERWKEFESVTAWEWLERKLGKRAFRRTLGAQLYAKFGPRAREVSMVWFWNKIYLRTQSRPGLLAREKLGYIDGSFQFFIDRLAGAASQSGAVLSNGVGVEHIESGISGNRYSVRDTSGIAHEMDAIVVTTPAPIFLKLFPDTPDPYRSKLVATPYQGAVCLVARLDRQLTSTYWMNIADPAVPLTVVVEHTNFMDPDHYDGNHYVYINAYLEPDHELFDLPEAEVTDRHLEHLRHLNPEFDRSWVRDSWLFRTRAAQPIIGLHHSQKIPAHRTPYDHVYLATMSQIYPEDRGTNYAVALGERVARLVQEDIP